MRDADDLPTVALQALRTPRDREQPSTSRILFFRNTDADSSDDLLSLRVKILWTCTGGTRDLVILHLSLCPSHPNVLPCLVIPAYSVRRNGQKLKTVLPERWQVSPVIWVQ